MSVRDVIDHYQAVLSRFGTVVDFDISGLDRLGIPVGRTDLHHHAIQLGVPVKPV